MKTYEDLYKDYQSYIDEKPDIDTDEYDVLMNSKITLVEVMNKLLEYQRFAVFSTKWIEDNKEELVEGLKNNENKDNG